MNDFIPGPWNPYFLNPLQILGGGYIIANIVSDKRSNPASTPHSKALANGRLIAAAPEMHELLCRWKLRGGTDPALLDLATETAQLMGRIEGREEE